MNARFAWLDVLLAVAAASAIAWGITALGWSVFAVMALFWLENVVVGVFNIARMLVTGLRGGFAMVLGALLTSAFFAFHYGMFTAIHGLFVVVLFGAGDVGREALDGGLLTAALGMIHRLLIDRDGWLAVTAIVALHLAGFVHWLAASRGRSIALKDLMGAPYGRIVVLHITLIGGAFLIQVMRSPAAGALLLVALKLAYDLFTVRRELRAEDARQPQELASRLLTIGRRNLHGRP
jgi:hypothetical protein